MIVVSNTTPLSELAKVGQIKLLQEVFGQIIIPQEVYNEVTTGTHPAAREIQFVNWIKIFSIRNRQQVSILQAETGLDLGESATIILAEELGADRVLIDELAARKVAQSRNIPITGTVGILLVAKNQGLISSVKPILDALIAQGTRIGQVLYQEILAIAQES
ncbi:MAG: DUF3368 domain-containing protein [Symploca sp. SIO1B1]|nr:DUF3368 domain-containing protein [Symploca sp. SIO1B1]